MGRSKKAGKSRSKATTFIKKHPAVIFGIMLCLLGILFLVTAFSPPSAGKVGMLINQRFLGPAFGKASVLAGAYCLALGLVLLAAGSKTKYIAGLTCLLQSEWMRLFRLSAPIWLDTN